VYFTTSTWKRNGYGFDCNHLLLDILFCFQTAATGVLDEKKILADFSAMTTDAEWKTMVTPAAKKCIKDAAGKKNLKCFSNSTNYYTFFSITGATSTAKSKYKTSCKLQAMVFQTCFMIQLLKVTLARIFE
jgi:hypothetical protein